MTNSRNHQTTGVWIIGALGETAVTTMLGALALRHNLIDTTGLVTELDSIQTLDLVPWDTLVFGGHDIRHQTLVQVANELYHHSRTFSSALLEGVSAELSDLDTRIINDATLTWEVSTKNTGQPSLETQIERQRHLLREFIDQNKLDHCVVVNLASAEVSPLPDEDHQTLAGFQRLIANNQTAKITPSMAWAYSAFNEGCSYINFTPSVGANIPALIELANTAALPHYGNDGKTGETLVKTCLAPMFAYRNLNVMSWEGVNMLGNNDGKTLNNPENAAGKLKNKGEVLKKILGYPLHDNVAINYVPSLGDWKTAWDFIHFKGFMDVPMTMQFTWQGCDSILAAPLVLDMVRLSEFAARHQEGGLMYHLACFFKKPLGIEEMSLHPQFDMLLEYVHKHSSH